MLLSPLFSKLLNKWIFLGAASLFLALGFVLFPVFVQAEKYCVCSELPIETAKEKLLENIQEVEQMQKEGKSNDEVRAALIIGVDIKWVCMPNLNEGEETSTLVSQCSLRAASDGYTGYQCYVREGSKEAGCGGIMQKEAQDFVYWWTAECESRLKPLITDIEVPGGTENLCENFSVNWHVDGGTPVSNEAGDAGGPTIITSAPFSLGVGAGKLNQIGGKVTLQGLLGKIIKTILQLLGSIALVMFVYAGIIWMFSGGSPDKRAHAQKILVQTGLGVIVVLSSYVVVNFVFEAFKK